MINNPHVIQKIWILSLGQEDPLIKGMTTYYSFSPEEFHGQRNPTGDSPWGLRVRHI